MLLCFKSAIYGQSYQQLTALSGTQVVDQNTVTVTSTRGRSVNYCKASPYWIGYVNDLNARFSFDFSVPVFRVKVQLTAMNKGEYISFTINGAPYTLTQANLSDFPGDCNQDQAVLSGGVLTVPDSMLQEGAGGEINITDFSGISSLSVIENKGIGNGSVFSLFISMHELEASYMGPLCLRDTLQLFAVSTISNADYSWTGPAGFTSKLQNPVLPDVSQANAGLYRVTLTKGNASITDTVIVDFLPSPEPPEVSYPPTVCGTDLTLTATTTPAGVMYAWTGPDSFSSASQNPVIPNAVTYNQGTYIVVANIGRCRSSTDVVVVLEKGALKLDNTDTIVCQGTVLQLSSEATPGYAYQWSPTFGLSDSVIPNPLLTITKPLTYTLRASYPGCPDTTVSIKFGMEYLPQVDLGPDRAVCSDMRVGLESSVQPYRKDYTYRWTPVTPDLEYSDRPHTSFVADTTITYYLTVKSSIGCTGMDSIRILVYPGDFGAAIADTGLCLPDVIQLWAEGGTEYAWSPAYGLDDTTLARPIAAPETSTDYTVYIRDGHGCLDSQQVSVQVYPSAIIQMPDTVNIYSGERYHLEPLTNCGYFEWFPPSGLSGVAIADPWMSPEVRTRYFVTARTEQGCVVKDSIDVQALCFVMDMPNAFRPGSSNNGSFMPARRGIAELKRFTLFNRWGQKLFETADIEQGWDGTYKNKPQPIDVYVYIIEAITACGDHYYKKGNVTLIR